MRREALTSSDRDASPVVRPAPRWRSIVAPMVASVALSGLLTGCGGDSPLNPSEIRLCLSDSGYRTYLPESSSIPGSVAPDLVMQRRGAVVEIVVDRTPARARRRAADIEGALTTYGIPAASSRVETVANATAVFDGRPRVEERRSVTACLTDPSA